MVNKEQMIVYYFDYIQCLQSLSNSTSVNTEQMRMTITLKSSVMAGKSYVSGFQ
jgi:hypothetical protein